MFKLNKTICNILANDDFLDDEKNQMIDKLDIQSNDKLDTILTYCYHENARLEGIKNLIKEQLEALKTAENKVNNLQNYAKAVMQNLGIDEIKSQFLPKIKLVNNGGVIPLIVNKDVDVDSLSDEFIKIKKEIDNKAVRECLEAGEVLEFAKLGERGKSFKFK